MIKVLELFSGTRSIGKCCDSLGWESVSVDLFMPADHNCDIMDFDYKQYPKDYFDIVWASPPCTEYSQLQYCWIGRERNGEIFTNEKIEEKMREADKLVLKTLEIIDYFNPEYYFIENPNGRLKNREIMKDRPYYLVDYCMYSNWGYQKRTCIWTNKKDFKPLLCNKKCGNIGSDGKHSSNLGTISYAEIDGKLKPINTAELRKQFGHLVIKNKRKSISREEKYRVPPDLIYSLFLD